MKKSTECSQILVSTRSGREFANFLSYRIVYNCFLLEVGQSNEEEYRVFRSSLIWACPVCLGLFGRNFRTFTILYNYFLLKGGQSNEEEYRVFPNLGINQISLDLYLKAKSLHVPHMTVVSIWIDI